MHILWHLKQILLAFDQTLNAILGGWADESFSARCYRHRFQLGWRVLMTIFNALFFSSTHCKKAYESEKQRLHVPAEYRKIDDQPRKMVIR